MRLELNVGVSKSVIRYSTVVRKSPRIDSSLRANTMFLCVCVRACMCVCVCVCVCVRERERERSSIIFSSDTHPCWINNGGCSHLCLTTPSEKARLVVSCKCPTGFVLMSDKKTCQSCKFN